MVTLDEGCLASEGGGTDLGEESGRGEKEACGLVAGDMSFWATWGVAWSGTTYLWWLQSPWNPPGGVSSPIPDSEEVDLDLSMVGCFPGRAPKLENLKLLPGSHQPSPPFCVPGSHKGWTPW